MEYQNPAPQKCTFLKVMGIIMIIGGAAGVIIGLVAVLGILALTIAVSDGAGLAILLVIASIILTAGSIIQLIAGIQGVKNCDKPQFAQKCITLGIVIIVLTVLSNVLTVVADPTGLSIPSIFTGLVVPVLYLIAAFQCKKMA